MTYAGKSTHLIVSLACFPMQNLEGTYRVSLRIGQYIGDSAGNEN